MGSMLDRMPAPADNFPIKTRPVPVGGPLQARRPGSRPGPQTETHGLAYLPTAREVLGCGGKNRSSAHHGVRRSPARSHVAILRWIGFWPYLKLQKKCEGLSVRGL